MMTFWLIKTLTTVVIQRVITRGGGGGGDRVSIKQGAQRMHRGKETRRKKRVEIKQGAKNGVRKRR